MATTPTTATTATSEPATSTTSTTSTPTTPISVPLANGFTLALDPALGFVQREVRHDPKFTSFPGTYPPGVALRGPSNMTVRAWVEHLEQPSSDDFTYNPNGVTGRVTAEVALPNGRSLSLLINGDEVDLRGLADTLRSATPTIDATDPFGWLISTLGSHWALVGDSRHGFEYATDGTSVLSSKGDDWVRVIVARPLHPITDVATLGLVYTNVDLVDVSGTFALYQENYVGSGSGPFAILIHPGTGAVVTVSGTGGPRTLVDLALGMKRVAISDLTAGVVPIEGSQPG